MVGWGDIKERIIHSFLSADYGSVACMKWVIGLGVRILEGG